MPHVHVPLTRHPPSTRTLRVSYTLRGHGSILVVLLPGLCVPSNMYDAMASFLAATSQFTTIAVDNRGMGDSDKPYASIFNAPGYTVSELAQDAWDIVDHVIQNHPSSSFHSHVALIGHSMGGMIIQSMLSLRPHTVRFMALLATHAGGLWNMLPTLTLVASGVRLALSGFDKNVHAAINLSLHFTQRFLDDVIDIDDHIPYSNISSIHSIPKAHTDSQPQLALSSNKSNVPNTLRHRRPANNAPPHNNGNVSANSQKEKDAPSSLYRRLNFVESKVIEFARDAHIYFGLSVVSLPEKFRHPKQFLLDTIVNGAKQYCAARRTRWDIYHARYTGTDDDLDSVNPTDTYTSNQSQPVNYTSDDEHKPQNLSLASSVSSSSIQADNALKKDSPNISNAVVSKSPSSTASMSSPDTSLYSYYGHLAVVRSHYLTYKLARQLRNCRSIVKLSVIGKHDSVITPSSSRSLANIIDANTVVELDAAHFITDEAAAEVTTHIVYGLRKAFLAPNTRPCPCPWCESK